MTFPRSHGKSGAEINPEICSLGSHPVPQPENALTTSCASQGKAVVAASAKVTAAVALLWGLTPHFLKLMEKVLLN